MKLLPGTSTTELGMNIASNLKIPLLELEFKYFVSEETYLKINGSIKNQEIILIQNTGPPQEKNLMELLFIASTLKELGAIKVHCVVPYLCYARSDKRRLTGEVTSHQISLDLIQKSGIDSLITANVHNSEIFLNTNEKLKKYDLDCTQLLIAKLEQAKEKNWFIIGPDKGRYNEVRNIAQKLSKPFDTLDKYRDPHTHKVSVQDTGFDCEDKDLVLVDDEILSGGTVFAAIEILKKKNPASITYFCVHALAKMEVFDKMKKVGISDIVSTNTIPREDIEQLDISSLLSEFIEKEFL